MFAQINHMAMTSAQWPMLGRFYEAVFGLKTSNKSRPMNGFTLSDGYCGMNINPRRDGYVGGLDHFGMVVEDVEKVLDRMRRKHTDADIVKRPSTRPFAAYSGHDPDGNVFDLAQKDQNTISDVYAQQAAQGWHQDRYLNKFTIRTPHADKVADFYQDVFELKPANIQADAPGYHLTDGRVTLSIMKWSIPLFEGMAIKRPGPDHIGFHVESIEALKADVQKVIDGCTFLAPVPLGGNKEGQTRKRLLERSATGSYQLSDPDGCWIDVTEG